MGEGERGLVTKSGSGTWYIQCAHQQISCVSFNHLNHFLLSFIVGILTANQIGIKSV